MYSKIKPYEVQSAHRHYIELHLSVNTDLPAKHGREIHGLMGTYSHCRGDGGGGRFVFLPLNEDGIALAVELIAAYGPGSVLASREQLRRRAVTTILRSRDGVEGQKDLASSEAYHALTSWMGKCEIAAKANDEAKAKHLEDARNAHELAVNLAGDELAWLRESRIPTHDGLAAARLRLIERAQTAFDALLASKPKEER
jgi:hypothetical protein